MNKNNEKVKEDEELDEANKAASKQNIEQQIEKEEVEKKEIKEPEKTTKKPLSLMEKMSSIEENMKALAGPEAIKSKKKNFKMPMNVKRQTKNLKKLMEKNKVQVLLFKTAGQIQPTIGEINAGRLIVGEMYWDAAGDITWQWMGKTPTVAVCEWDMLPITKSRLMEDTGKNKTWMHAQTIIIRMIQAKEAADKVVGGAKMKPAVFIAIGVIGLVLYYLFLGGG